MPPTCGIMTSCMQDSNMNRCGNCLQAGRINKSIQVEKTKLQVTPACLSKAQSSSLLPLSNACAFQTRPGAFQPNATHREHELERAHSLLLQRLERLCATLSHGDCVHV